jgi:RimJ/RimL family protein N-acetyltransferase
MAMKVPSQTSSRPADSAVSTRPWTHDDAAWYIDHLDGEIARWTLENVNVDDEAWRESVSRSLATGSIWHAIECCGKPVGNIKAVPMSDHIAISYWVASEERGNGYASHALATMTRRAVDSGWGRPIELEIHPDNGASIGTATRVGYSFYEMRDSCNACSDDTGKSAIYRWPA